MGDLGGEEDEEGKAMAGIAIILFAILIVLLSIDWALLRIARALEKKQ